MKKSFILAFAALVMLSCSEKNTPSNSNGSSATSPASIEGELTGVFSVSPTKKVHFSKGNFQYQKSTKTCRFAEHQYDRIGYRNRDVIMIESLASEWFDLFAWGTGITPDLSNYHNSSAYYGKDGENISGTDRDWGVYNKIINGGNEPGLWRTLTYEEWQYILKERPNASILFGFGKVYSVEGLILLPDGWVTPNGLTFNASTENGLDPTYYNSKKDNYSHNSYTETEWRKMEAAGAVFLPSTGMLSTSYTDAVYNSSASSNKEYAGHYWSSTFAYELIFSNADIRFFTYSTTAQWKSNVNQYAVRLVKDLK